MRQHTGHGRRPQEAGCPYADKVTTTQPIQGLRDAYPTKAFVTHLTLAWHMLASHDAVMDVQPLRIAICRGVCAPFPASKGSSKSSITTSYDAYGKVLTHIC
mmetsp:Transcript_3549/g.5138  ORF Transcript_3549/g.5138 Transcript_3549/m.5138 type:complete len:102 (-) Transcript_3549:92-397(-)